MGTSGTIAVKDKIISPNSVLCYQFEIVGMDWKRPVSLLICVFVKWKGTK